MEKYNNNITLEEDQITDNFKLTVGSIIVAIPFLLFFMYESPVEFSILKVFVGILFSGAFSGIINVFIITMLTDIYQKQGYIVSTERAIIINKFYNKCRIVIPKTQNDEEDQKLVCKAAKTIESQIITEFEQDKNNKLKLEEIAAKCK
jgi:hypothetical protein